MRGQLSILRRYFAAEVRSKLRGQQFTCAFRFEFLGQRSISGQIYDFQALENNFTQELRKMSNQKLKMVNFGPIGVRNDSDCDF